MSIRSSSIAAGRQFHVHSRAPALERPGIAEQMDELGAPGTATPMRSLAAVIAAVACLLGPASASAGTVAPAQTRLAQIHHACAAPPPGHLACFALVRTPVAAGTPASAGATPYVVDSGASSPGPAGGLTPEQLAGAYGYEPSGGGAGQTVGIVDAYDDPKIDEDLGTFDAKYALSACTTENGCFKKVGQTGSTESLPAADTTGWSEEISLDVETVHAVCPNCKILLVEANSPSFADLATAVNEAVALGATEVSNSYGGPEFGTGVFEQNAYNHPGVPIIAASGDTGYYGWIYVNDLIPGAEMPNTPASLPTVVAVGGTSLKLNASGTRTSETVWNENGPGDEFGRFVEPPLGATGGGCSRLFTAEPWQREVGGYGATGCGKARLVADVSAVGDPATGFDIYDSYKCGPECEFPRVEGGWATFGGTSLSAQLIGALYGLVGGGGGVKYPSLTLYGDAADASSSYDVRSGGNGFCGGESVELCREPNSKLGALVDCEGTTSCNAAPGFDGPSGVGTPIGLGLFKPELPTAVITPPGSLVAGAPASFNAGGSTDPYPGGSIASFSWSWGDGTADSVGTSPSHTYATPGGYNVTLTVTDNYGLTSTVTKASIKVSAPCAASPAIESQPASTTVMAPNAASFTVKEGTVPPNCLSGAIQWQASADSGVSWNNVSGANLSGTNSATLQINPTSASESGHEFRAVLTNAHGATESSPATLTVNAPPCAASPAIENQPASATVTAPSAASFTVKEAAVRASCSVAAIQWQVSADLGASWSDVSGANFSGATAATLQINPTNTSEFGHEFRAVLTNAHGATESNAATLMVDAPSQSPGGGGSTGSGISGSGSPGSGSQGLAGFKEESLTSPGPDAKLASTALQASLSGAVSIKISCPTGESSCSGTVTLRTEGAVIAGAGSSTKAKGTILTLATASFTLAGGQVKTVTLHLSTKARRLLARYRVLHVRATIVAHDPAGATHTTRTIVTLHAPKSTHGRG
jgi:PKD repeat protein